MIKRSISVPHQAVNDSVRSGHDELSPENHYRSILQDFHKYDHSKNSTFVAMECPGSSFENEKDASTESLTPPSSLGEVEGSSPKNTADEGMANVPTCTNSAVIPKLTRTTNVRSSLTDESRATHSYTKKINVSLISENRRLKRMLRAMERKIPKDSTDPIDSNKNKPIDDAMKSKEAAERVDQDVTKLNRKVKSLKFKCRDERAKSLQMEKSLEVHQHEIEGLRMELGKALDQVDSLERDRESDQLHLTMLTNELDGWRQGDKSPSETRLEQALRERNDELESTLELLESKVAKILELETKLQIANQTLRVSQDANILLSNGDGNQSFFSVSTSIKSVDLRESQAECRKLKSENLLLKLLFEELYATRKDDDGDLDSVFQKVAELGIISEAQEDVGIWSGLSSIDDGQFVPYQSPTSVVYSISDLPSASTSVEAEDLFQKEIERVNFENSSTSSFGCFDSPTPAKNYLEI